MTTQQAVIRNLFKNKLLGSICVFSTVSYFHILELLLELILSHQKIEDFNEILNYVQYSELTDAVMNISSFKKMIWCSSGKKRYSQLNRKLN